MTTRIGIAAVSPEGGAMCYRQIARHAARLQGRVPEFTITVHNLPLRDYLTAIERSDWHDVARLLRETGAVLREAGAELCVSPDHAVAHAVQLAAHGSVIPWMSPAACVAERLKADGKDRIGLIGASPVTRGAAYQAELGMAGVHTSAPAEQIAHALDCVIYRELPGGQLSPEGEQTLNKLVTAYRESGCDALVLACSEASLLRTLVEEHLGQDEASGVRLYDASELLAEFAASWIGEQSDNDLSNSDSKAATQ